MSFAARAVSQRFAPLIISFVLAGCAFSVRASDPQGSGAQGASPGAIAPAALPGSRQAQDDGGAAGAAALPPALSPASNEARVPVAPLPPAADVPVAAPAPALLPPVTTTGAAPAAPEAPQGLGIGTPSGGAPFAAGGRLVLETGLYSCDLKRRVIVRRIAEDGQSLILNWLGKDHDFTAVQARTGALRFENAAEGLVWLVIIGKSMLLDGRKGQQLANECKL